MTTETSRFGRDRAGSMGSSRPLDARSRAGVVAQIAAQRLVDVRAELGSLTYRALAADAVSLEARILAVADVVEAMASHRPYRAALGLDAALDEIMRGRGRLYDPDVVDACRDLFRYGGFDFED